MQSNLPSLIAWQTPNHLEGVCLANVSSVCTWRTRLLRAMVFLADRGQAVAAHAVLGKVEGEGKHWHGHVTAVSVASDSRRLGLASKLMHALEDTTEKVYAPNFNDHA